MASIQSKKSKTGKKIYYVVVSLRGKYKWIKAGNLATAKNLKKQIEGLQDSERLEKLGFTPNDKIVTDFFNDYSNHIKLHTSESTTQRYLGIINTFQTFLNLYHPQVKYLSDIKYSIIESYQQKRLESIELKIASDGDKNGVHKKKNLPKPQTVNYELGILQSAFIWAQNQEYISQIPTKKIKSLKPKEQRNAIILTPKECKLFLKTARNGLPPQKRIRS